MVGDAVNDKVKARSMNFSLTRITGKNRKRGREAKKSIKSREGMIYLS